MSGMEKSDLPEVARKRANKVASAAAEPVERKGWGQGLQSMVRTQSREAVSQAQARIREADRIWPEGMVLAKRRNMDS
jgi:RNA-directed DNA polymerase